MIQNAKQPFTFMNISWIQMQYKNIWGGAAWLTAAITWLNEWQLLKQGCQKCGIELKTAGSHWVKRRCGRISTRWHCSSFGDLDQTCSEEGRANSGGREFWTASTVSLTNFYWKLFSTQTSALIFVQIAFQQKNRLKKIKVWDSGEKSGAVTSKKWQTHL